jgi:hypothetical protein
MKQEGKDDSMNNTKRGSPPIDRARELLCRELARMVNAGASALRVRIVGAASEPTEAWFYSHAADGWRKEMERVTEPELVAALEETLDMLASKGRGDEWSTRQHASADSRDTDFQFHRDKLEGRVGDALESVLTGLLFRDGHDSKKDSRRSIRTRR